MQSFISILTILSATAASISAQVTLTEADAIALVLKNSPALQAVTLQVKQQKQLQGTGFNLDNPDITLESPTGEFITVGVLQSFQFPTVYARQVQLNKQQTLLSEKEKAITESTIVQQARLAYLNLQYAQALLRELYIQDSLFLALSEAAEKQFKAGQADKLSSTYAAARRSETYIQYTEVQLDAESALQQLQTLLGITDSIVTEPLTKSAFNILPLFQPLDSSATLSAPLLHYYQQQQNIAKKSWQLERNKALPGFSFGYLNQSAKSTAIPLRLRAGINIPIWFWQYSAAIKAAKTGMAISEQNTRFRQQSLLISLQQAQYDIRKYSNSLAYYESTTMKQADELVLSSRRMYEAGESDLIAYLRTLADAWNMKRNYLVTLKEYDRSIIHYQYLNGQ